MVSASFVGGLASRAVFLLSSQAGFKSAAEYQGRTVDGIEALQTWYNRQTGLWDTTGWWNAANCLTVLGDFAVLRPAPARELGLAEVIQNTYEQAQKTPVRVSKFLDATTGLTISSFSRVERRDLEARGFDNFINEFYDDEGWWALALVRAHDLGVQGLGDQRYLQEAQDIFEDMKKGESPCGGGILVSSAPQFIFPFPSFLFLDPRKPCISLA